MAAAKCARDYEELTLAPMSSSRTSAELRYLALQYGGEVLRIEMPAGDDADNGSGQIFACEGGGDRCRTRSLGDDVMTLDEHSDGCCD